MQIPFIGGSYIQRSPSLNAQKSINCFPVLDDKEPKDVIALYGTPGLKFFASATVYGSGADGAVTISADTVLTRDMAYTTLTINSGKVLDTAGFIVSCSVLLTNNGIITDSQSGGAGGAGGVNGFGKDGETPILSGAGSGGKGGYSTSISSTGATGGKGGGLVRIYAKTLTNNGVIHADGFDAPSDMVGSGWGSAGGNGGTVELTYDARTVGTVRANAGNHS